MASDWRILPCTSETFPLLIRSHFQENDYTVHVTDLSRLWSETLTRTQIIQNAIDVASPINPEDDSSQMQILLGKIQGALGGSDGVQMSRTADDMLQLRLNIPLPGDLSDLHWTMSLRQLSASSIRSELTGPMVGLLSTQKRQIDQLSNYLSEKDNAISRILDKIDSMGLDYGTVFPNARFTKRGNQREQVVKHVRGLAVFDKEKWRADFDRAGVDTMNISDMIGLAFAGISSSSVHSIAQNVSWTLEERGVPDVRNDKYLADGTRKGRSPKPQSQSQADEFQRQKTPERAKRPQGVSPVVKEALSSPQTSPTEVPSPPLVTAKTAMEEDSSTEDDDLDAPFQSKSRVTEWTIPSPSKSRLSSPDLAPETSNAAAPKKKMGRIGKQATPQDEVSATTTPSSDTDPSKFPHPVEERRSSSASPKPTPRKRLGGLLRRTTESPAHPPLSESTTPDLDVVAPTPSQPNPAPPRKLGKIGGRRAPTPDNSVVPSSVQRSSQDGRTKVPSVEPSALAPPERKLGKIGGVRHALKEDDAPTAAPAVRETAEADQGDVAASEEQPSIASAPTLRGTASSTVYGKKATEAPAPQEPELTVQEKADRKREQLNREMEEAKPVVKKRKKF